MNLGRLGVLLQGYGGGMGDGYPTHFPDDYNGADMSGLGFLGDLDPNAIASPSRDLLESETKKLHDQIAQLARDWNDSDGNSVSQSQLTRWRSFTGDVSSWDWGPAWIAHLIGTTWRDELLAFQKTFNGFVDEWHAAGVNVTVPGFTFTAAPPSTAEKLIDAGTKPFRDAAKAAADTAGAIKWTAIGLGGVAVAYIFYLTFETGRTARSIGPRVVGNPRRRRRKR